MTEMSEDLRHLMKRAETAYQKAMEATSKRERTKQESNFYATTEAIYWVLRSSSNDK